MATSILNIHDEVLKLLTEHKHLRDSDDKLVATIWKFELQKMGLNPTQFSAFKLLDMYAKGQLTNPQSITRSRRKAQEENEELRGENYAKRHAHQETIKDEIRQLGG